MSLLPPLSIVIPVYNERRGVSGTVKKVAALLPQLPEGSEAIFVDDGSTDGTGELLKTQLSQYDGLNLVAHFTNRGYGAALKTGIRHAMNDWIAIADADGTYPIERLGEFIQTARTEEAAMVVGARPVGDQPAIRRPAKAVLRWLAEYLTGVRIPDMNSGLRIFRREDALRLSRLLPDGFSFTTTITMALLTEGEKVIYLPIRYKVRLGSSKIKPIRDTATFLLLICRTSLAFNPMKVFGPVGLGFLAIGVLFLLLRFIAPNPFGVATTVSLLIGGLQFLAIGLLADLVNRRGQGFK